jgi:hypothetical protein
MVIMQTCGKKMGVHLGDCNSKICSYRNFAALETTIPPTASGALRHTADRNRPHKFYL